jgi:hypothetical protein
LTNHLVSYNFDDPEGDPCLEEPDQDDDMSLEYHPSASSSSMVSRPTPSAPTPAGFCTGCGDSLSTEMHLINGPCDQPSRPLVRVAIPRVPDRPLNRIPVPVFSNGNGLCAMCGDSLSTPMHLSNGPCL